MGTRGPMVIMAGVEMHAPKGSPDAIPLAVVKYRDKHGDAESKNHSPSS